MNFYPDKDPAKQIRMIEKKLAKRCGALAHHLTHDDPGGYGQTYFTSGFYMGEIEDGEDVRVSLADAFYMEETMGFEMRPAEDADSIEGDELEDDDIMAFSRYVIHHNVQQTVALDELSSTIATALRDEIVSDEFSEGLIHDDTEQYDIRRCQEMSYYVDSAGHARLSVYCYSYLLNEEPVLEFSDNRGELSYTVPIFGVDGAIADKRPSVITPKNDTYPIDDQEIVALYETETVRRLLAEAPQDRFERTRAAYALLGRIASQRLCLDR